MHVGIIMDGNGRWATHRGLPRAAGHAEGAKSVRTVVETAAREGIDTLTLYAFSAANWARPPAEIAALMKLFGQYLFTETRRCVEQSICVNVIGRRDRLSDNLLHSIEQSERLSASCTGMHLRVAVDYSSQYSLTKAAGACRTRCRREHGIDDRGYRALFARGRSFGARRRAGRPADPHRE